MLNDWGQGVSRLLRKRPERTERSLTGVEDRFAIFPSAPGAERVKLLPGPLVLGFKAFVSSAAGRMWCQSSTSGMAQKCIHKSFFMKHLGKGYLKCAIVVILESAHLLCSQRLVMEGWKDSPLYNKEEYPDPRRFLCPCWLVGPMYCISSTLCSG